MPETLFLSIFVFFTMTFSGVVVVLISYVNKHRALKPPFKWQQVKKKDILYLARDAVELRMHIPYSVTGETLLLGHLAIFLFTSILLSIREGDIVGAIALGGPSVLVYVIFLKIFQKVRKIHYHDLQGILREDSDEKNIKI